MFVFNQVLPKNVQISEVVKLLHFLNYHSLHTKYQYMNLYWVQVTILKPYEFMEVFCFCFSFKTPLML